MKNTPDIQWLKIVDSTNAEARRRISECCEDIVIAASEQTAGRGQGDHKWSSLPGQNITLSILIHPGLEVQDADLLSCAVTLGIIDYLTSNGVRSRIKLPNDIWVGADKISGMLIENILDGSLIRESIIGIGLNLNQTEWPADIPNPVSLSLLTGKKYKAKDEAASLCSFIFNRISDFSSDSGRSLLRREFADCSNGCSGIGRAED